MVAVKVAIWGGLSGARGFEAIIWKMTGWLNGRFNLILSRVVIVIDPTPIWDGFKPHGTPLHVYWYERTLELRMLGTTLKLL